MRLCEFVEDLLEDKQDIAIVIKDGTIFNGLALDAYRERKGNLGKYWKSRIKIVKSAYDVQTSYLAIILDDRYIMDD